VVTGDKTNNLDNYMIVTGHAYITEGGAPELLNKLAGIYKSDLVFDTTGFGGYITHIVPEKISGIGPWKEK
jgi:hypothetical protein